MSVIGGLPKNEETYWQEVGRAGRNRQKAFATLYVVRNMFTAAIDTGFLDSVRGVVFLYPNESLQAKATKSPKNQNPFWKG